MRLFLTRHAQTAWNAEGKAQGHTDVPLDETGRAQSRALAEALKDQGIRRVLSSDLQRCVETAKAVADFSGADLITRTDLRERGFGDWEGLGFEELRRRNSEVSWYEKVDFEAVVPPNGESIEMVWNRLLPVVEEIRAMRETTLVVTHGGTCSLVMAHLLRGTVYTARGFRFANTGLSELDRKPDGNQILVRYNSTAHLIGIEALTGGLEGSNRKA